MANCNAIAIKNTVEDTQGGGGGQIPPPDAYKRKTITLLSRTTHIQRVLREAKDLIISNYFSFVLCTYHWGVEVGGLPLGIRNFWKFVA